MQYFGHRLHARRRCLRPSEPLPRQSQSDLRRDGRRRRNRRRHRGAHRRTDPLAAGELARGGDPAPATDHLANGNGRGHLVRKRNRRSQKAAAHPAPSLPRHRERPPGRGVRRAGALLRRRRHMGAPDALRTAAVVDPRRGTALLRHPLDLLLQPVRRLRTGLLHHVVRRTGRTLRAAEARNGRLPRDRSEKGGGSRSPCARSAKKPFGTARRTAT